MIKKKIEPPKPKKLEPYIPIDIEKLDIEDKEYKMEKWDGILEWETDFLNVSKSIKKDIKISESIRTWLDQIMKDMASCKLNRVQQICKELHTDIKCNFKNLCSKPLVPNQNESDD